MQRNNIQTDQEAQIPLAVEQVSDQSNAMPLWKGLLKASPIMTAYIPLGMAFGFAAVEAQVSLTASMFMSLIVYTGAAQFVAVGMMAMQDSLFSIVLATMLINLRYFVYTSALFPLISKWSALKRVLFALQITDETFALYMTEPQKIAEQRPLNMCVNAWVHVSWMVGTYCGYTLRTHVAGAKDLGFEYVLTAMFIAFVVMQIKDGALFITALIAGSIGVWCHINGASHFGVITAAICAPLIGMGVRAWQNRKSS